MVASLLTEVRTSERSLARATYELEELRARGSNEELALDQSQDRPDKSAELAAFRIEENAADAVRKSSDEERNTAVSKLQARTV